MVFLDAGTVVLNQVPSPKLQFHPVGTPVEVSLNATFRGATPAVTLVVNLAIGCRGRLRTEEISFSQSSTAEVLVWKGAVKFNVPGRIPLNTVLPAFPVTVVILPASGFGYEKLLTDAPIGLPPVKRYRLYPASPYWTGIPLNGIGDATGFGAVKIRLVGATMNWDDGPVE